VPLDRLLRPRTVISIDGDSYGMLAHQAGISALRLAITGGKFS
jgi:hypothetical protein